MTKKNSMRGRDNNFYSHFLTPYIRHTWLKCCVLLQFFAVAFSPYRVQYLTHYLQKRKINRDSDLIALFVFLNSCPPPKTSVEPQIF